MKQKVEIIAYIFSDVSGTLRALRFADGIRVIRRRGSRFEIQTAANRLPEGFFSKNTSHVSAVVGSNTSGKSTVLQDINRILAGQQPIAIKFALVIRCDQGLYQLCNDHALVQCDGQKIRVGDASHNTNLKVVFYAGGYDPLGRTTQLVPNCGNIVTCDISDQFVYSFDPAHDFDYKLIYLQSLIEANDPSLLLETEGRRKRVIRFESRAGYDINEAARDFVEFALTLPSNRDHINELLTYLGLNSPDDKADLHHAIEIKLILMEKGTHFLPVNAGLFEGLYSYLKDRKRSVFLYSRLEFALAIGGIVKRLHADPASLATRIGTFRTGFKTLVINALGQQFHDTLTVLRFAAEKAPPGTLSKDHSSVSITLSGDPDTTESTQDIVRILLRLRTLGAEFSFRFTGISEGQRTLLSFYSRLFMQARKFQHDGNTLLLIDEHEHGLHPEWQRRYLNELLTFLQNPAFASERYQIILSTHSPFLVSDLPGTLVNRIGTDVPDNTPTLAANLMELLLSPLFLENSTGEFSRLKIEEMLHAFHKARSTDDVDAASALLPLLGDDLIRNYCAIRAEEKKNSLIEKQARQHRLSTGSA